MLSVKSSVSRSHSVCIKARYRVKKWEVGSPKEGNVEYTVTERQGANWKLNGDGEKREE